MSSRRATATFAALLVALFALLALGLLVVDALRPPPVDPAGDSVRPALGAWPAPPTPPAANDPVADAAPPAPVDPVPPPDVPETPEPDPRSVAGMAVVEPGGWPVAGVRFFDAERLDKFWIPRLEGAVNDEVESGTDGRFALRWPDDEPPVVMVRPPAGTRVTTVVGGNLEEDHDGTPVVRAAGATESLRIILSDGERETFLRLVEPDGSGPVPGNLRVRQRWLYGHAEPWLAIDEDLDADAGGWRRVHRPSEPPMREDVALPEVAFEIIAPGREVVRLSAAEVHGRREIVLPFPVAPVTGEVRAPAGTEAYGLRLHLRARDGRASGPAVRGLPTRFGPFTLLDVPDGAWTLECLTMTPTGLLRAEAEFDMRGGPVDVGTLDLVPGARARVRIVDSLGRSVPGVLLRIARVEDAGAPAGRSLEMQPTFRRGETLLFRAGRLECVMLRAPGSEVLDADGWWTFDGLRPGTRYRAEVEGFDGLEREFTAPEVGGTADVELRWEGRLVECVLTLRTGRGNPDWSRVTVSGPTLGASRPDAGGMLRVHLAAGEHDLMAVQESGPADGPRLFIYRGEVAVPKDRESFSAEVVLR